MSSLEVTSFTRHDIGNHGWGKRIFQGADLLRAPKYTCLLLYNCLMLVLTGI